MRFRHTDRFSPVAYSEVRMQQNHLVSAYPCGSTLDAPIHTARVGELRAVTKLERRIALRKEKR